MYYVTVPEYLHFMDVRQAINLGILEKFENEGVEFAYPTQTIHLARSASVSD